MNKLKIISFLLLFLFCCHEQKTTEFQKLCAEIPILQLPFYANCSNLEYFQKLSFTSPLDNERPSAFLVGRVFSDLQFLSLIYVCIADVNHPCLYTFTFDGAPIDTLEVVGTCFSNPYGVIQTFSAKIEQNRMISIIDTIKNYNLDSQENEIPESEIIIIRTKMCQLTNSGEFNLVFEDEKTVH